MPQNPFRLRASEQAMSDDQFLSLIGSSVLDMLPEDELWDRLVVLESAPGAGKTTILRLFTPGALRLLERIGRQEAHRPLYDHLRRLNVINLQGPTVVGVLINCREQYATIQDLPIEGPMQIRWFFGLLDSRIRLLTLRSILNLHGMSYPGDVARIEIRPNERATAPAEPITGQQLYDRASASEKALTDSLNSLVGTGNVSAYATANLLSTRMFSASDIYIDGVRMTERLLFMLDDVHELAPEQRGALQRELEQRDLTVARWIAQRSQAVEQAELLNFARTEGRDFVPVPIEEWARGSRGRGGRFFNLLDEIGNRRAQRAQIGVESFESCMASNLISSQELIRAEDASNKAKEHALSLAVGSEQFSEWIEDELTAAEQDLDPINSAIRWRRLAILIERQRRRPQLRLELALPTTLLEEQNSSSAQTAAELFLANEYGIPFYYGIRRIRQLSSWNIEQFLRMAGDLFEGVLASASLSRNRNRQLTPAHQDSLLRAVSQRRFSALQKEVPYGTDVQSLIRAIGAFCRDQTYRPTAPYAPGVTGVAISIPDGDRLREATSLAGEVPMGRLSRAVASAIANNVLEVRSEVKVKGGTWTVFFLNRLYCPVFELPLEYAGFRERRLDDLVTWMLYGFNPQRQGTLSL